MQLYIIVVIEVCVLVTVKVKYSVGSKDILNINKYLDVGMILVFFLC